MTGVPIPAVAPRGFVPAALLLILAMLPPGDALAGQTSCQVVRTDSIRAVMLGTGTRLVFAVEPVIECDDGTRVEADSAEVNEGQQYHRLFGNVRFQDPTRELWSDRADFFEGQDRLLAWGNVLLTQRADGSTVRGDTLEYFRANELRALDQVNVRGGRPRSELAPRQGAGSPYQVVSDRIFLEGEDRFRAVGMVEVTRDSLQAWGDTVVYEPDGETLLVSGVARIEGEDYHLSGRRILLHLPADELTEVTSTGAPVLVTEGLTLSAPRELRIALAEGEIQRLVAVAGMTPTQATGGGEAPPPAPQRAPTPLRPLPEGPPTPLPPGERAALTAPPTAPDTGGVEDRARAEAEEFLLLADSIEVISPGGALELVVAVGRARGESMREAPEMAPGIPAEEEVAAPPEAPAPPGEEPPPGDTLVADSLPERPLPLPEFLRRDWMEGDTILAYFLPVDPVPAGEEPWADPPPDDPAPTDLPPVPSLAAGETEASPRYRLDRLVARGNARSLYRVAASNPEEAEGRRAIHYVRGREIVVTMVAGEVERMEVEEPTGLHLEPQPSPGGGGEESPVARAGSPPGETTDSGALP